MPMTYPLGRGYFVWQRERCAGNDPGRMAAMAASAGLRWVSFKVHNGTASRNGDLTDHVRALRAVGVSVWGWGYCYGYQPVLEASIATRRCGEYGLDGYMLNAEHEYKAPGMAVRAATMVSTLAALAPSLPWGLCSYRYPTLHATLPWAVFLAGCAFHNPQVYWLEDDRPEAPTAQLARALRELTALRALPVVPLGVASPNDAATWLPTVTQLDNFHAACTATALPGYGWWSWEHAEARPVVWQAIARHAGAPTPTPPPAGGWEARVRAHLTAIRAELDALGG